MQSSHKTPKTRPLLALGAIALAGSLGTNLAYADTPESPATTPTLHEVLENYTNAPDGFDFERWSRDYCGTENDGVKLENRKGVTYSVNGEPVEGWVSFADPQTILVISISNPAPGQADEYSVNREVLKFTDTECKPGEARSTAEGEGDNTKNGETPETILEKEAQGEQSSWGLSRWIAYPLAAVIGLAVGVGGYLSYTRKKGKETEAKVEK
ncbi:hypothetical protein BSR28_05210 [Boudabousia liubingyangii]|uniref:hypothetical protein n=1 Tax=Boudabousia liubingyangii TaxID=1921764 RepID=UPI000938AE33|nr:hypothetical protein [Boudabousia liubingyangii]OKL46837.1 hypothetical protein BSR28_05210 [Boudabousia liubingyangii]